MANLGWIIGSVENHGDDVLGVILMTAMVVAGIALLLVLYNLPDDKP